MLTKSASLQGFSRMGALISLCLLVCPAPGRAQELRASETAKGSVEAGKTSTYSVRLEDGDFVTASIIQHEKINVMITMPNGRVLRRFFGPSGDAENEFEFAAEGGGIYGIALSNASEQPASYELTLKNILSLSERLQGDSWKEGCKSSALAELRRRFVVDERETNQFWKEVAERGLPLVEPLPNDSGHLIVTFLWRAEHDTRNVVVTGSFLHPGSPADFSLFHVGDSDVWCRSFRLPTGARFTYQLSPNDPLTFHGPREEQREATAQRDPLNPHTIGCPPGASKFVCQSVAELPGAVPQPWLARRPGIPRGTIEEATIRSTIQHLDRKLSIYVPGHYRRSGPSYPLVVLFDADEYLSPDFHLLDTLDNLIAASKIPPVIVVLIHHAGSPRLVDLIAGQDFSDAVATEVVPWVRAHYHVTKSPRHTVVGGYSAGGFAAAYMGLRHPEVFGNVLSQSGAFWWAPDHDGGICGGLCPRTRGFDDHDPLMDGSTEGNWMAHEYLIARKRQLRFYLDAGTFEIDVNGAGGMILEPTRHLRDVLRARGYEVYYQQFVGGHDELSWYGTIADGLIELLGGSATRRATGP